MRRGRPAARGRRWRRMRNRRGQLEGSCNRRKDERRKRGRPAAKEDALEETMEGRRKRKK
jgi:hypothetical protein